MYMTTWYIFFVQRGSRALKGSLLPSNHGNYFEKGTCVCIYIYIYSICMYTSHIFYCVNVSMCPVLIIQHNLKQAHVKLTCTQSKLQGVSSILNVIKSVVLNAALGEYVLNVLYKMCILCLMLLHFL